MRGATPNAVNICTNCHKGYTAHNGKSQNVQCADCHAGHVDEADGTTPNVWLVRRYMSYSTALTGKVNNRHWPYRSYFQSMVTKNYKDANGTGVCQSCHAPADYCPRAQPDRYQLQYLPHPLRSLVPNGGGSCTSCHGQPPHVNMAGGPNGYAGTYGTTTGVNEALTAHSTHATTFAYACAECHNGATHANGNFQQVYLNTAGYMAAKNGATPAYSTTARTCATTYCHSNGAITGRVSGSPVYTTAAWVNSKGTITGTAGECIACHGGAATSGKAMATGSHTAHVTTYSLGCKECHINTTTNGTSLVAGGAHLNGTGYVNGTDVKFDTAGSNAAGVYNSTVGNLGCTTTYCHSNGRGGAPKQVAQWGGIMPADCTGCHGGNATVATFKVMSSGKHLAHIKNAPPGGKFGCVDCHATTVTADTILVASRVNHVNGAMDYSGAKAGRSPLESVCQLLPQQWPVYPVYRATASWTSVTTYGCNGCHGADTTGPAGVFTSQFGEPNYNSYTTAGSTNFRNSHQKHVVVATDCQTCHVTATRTGFSILSTSTVHIDRVRNVAFNTANPNVATATYNSSLKTCSNVVCHSGTTVKWGSTLSCTGCHGYPPNVNVAGGPNGYAGTYGTTTGVSEATTAHATHATTFSLCLCRVPQRRHAPERQLPAGLH